MFKVRIRVSEETDIGAEIESLMSVARKHGLGEIQSFALERDAECILTELKRQHSETAPYGIHISLSKSLKTSDYEVIFDLSDAGKPSTKGGFFSRVFGK